MSKKGFIIGLTGLAIGGALIGAVTHHLTANKKVEKPNGGNSQVDVDENYKVYELPETLKYFSFETYDVSEDYELFSASSANLTYVLNKNTGKFSFLMNNCIRNVVDIERGLIAFNDGNVYHFDKTTAKLSKISALAGFESLVFIESEEEGLFARAKFSEDSEFSFLKLNEETFEIEEKFNIGEIRDYRKVLSFENFYFLSTTKYAYGNSLLIDKATGEVTNFNISMDDGSYFVKGNKIYFYGSCEGSYGYECLNLEDKTLTAVFYLDSQAYEMATLFEYEGGFLVGTMQDQTAKYVKFEDHSVTSLSNVSLAKIEDRQYIFSYVEDGLSYGTINEFNEETRSLEEVYRFDSSWGDRVVCQYEKLGDKHIVQCYSAYVGSAAAQAYSVMLEFSVEGEVTFKELALKHLIPKADTWSAGKIHELSKDVYVLDYAEYGFACYSFKYDVSKLIVSLNCDMVDYELKNDIVELIGSTGFKYEFNTETGATYCVGVVVD